MRRGSGGNPLYASELLRDGLGLDAAAPGAGRLGELIRRRVAMLPRDARELLDVAAVAGLEWGILGVG